MATKAQRTQVLNEIILDLEKHPECWSIAEHTESQTTFHCSNEHLILYYKPGIFFSSVRITHRADNGYMRLYGKKLKQILMQRIQKYQASQIDKDFGHLLKSTEGLSLKRDLSINEPCQPTTSVSVDTHLQELKRILNK